MEICSKLLAYNLVDVEGLVLLDEFFNMIEDQFEQAHLVVAPPDDGIYSSKLHDHDMVRDYRETMVFDTKYQKWEREPITGKRQIGSKFMITLEDLVDVRRRRGETKEFKSLHDLPKIGGFVPVPLRAGIFEWVITIDFNKQYPNAIMSSNAGIKTAINLLKYDDEHVYDKNGTVYQRANLIETPMGFFRKDIESVNKKKFMKWLDLRVKAQNMAKSYLKARKTIEDPMYKLLDGKQFRIKTFTNGGFGIMGLPADRNYSKFIFNNTTLMCQDLTKKMMSVLKELEYVVVGGDSVTGDTPLLLKKNGIIEIKTIDEIATWNRKTQRKEYGECEYEVWSENGFTKIKQVIRHKTKKKIFRVLTHCGCVDVTENHSLLNEDNKKIKPSELIIGNHLLYSFPENFPETKNELTIDECWLMGLFYANGTCGKYEYKSGTKYQWNISNANLDLLKKAKKIIPNSKILNTRNSSVVYKLVPTKSIKKMYLKYKCFYNKGYKTIPKIILNSSYEKRKAFFDGYYVGDGNRKWRGIRCDNKGKIGSMSLFYLMKSLGYNVSINTRKDKPNIFRLNGTLNKLIKQEGEIKKIEEIGIVDDYVYDLETENHHFQAGVGNLIVHNTDSCFVCLNSKKLEDAIQEATELVSKINKIIDNYLYRVYNIQKHTMKVGLETISDKFWVKAAKNYVKRNLWKDGSILDKPELEIKGISQKKRNTSKFVADLQSTMIDILLNSSNVEEDFKLLMKVLDKNFEKLPWTYIAPKGAINSDIDDYDIGNRNARGARNAREYFNKYFNPGDNPYIMPFKQFPKKLNGKFVAPYKGDVIVLSFDEEDVEEIKSLGFLPDYEELKRSQLNEKSKPFLSLMDTSYYKMRALDKVSNDMEL